MPTISAWLSDTGDLGGIPAATEQQRAAQAWRRINDKPTSIVFRLTTGSTIAAQTVRLESDDRASPAESAAGAAPKRKLIIFGIRNHATLASTDIKEGYRFTLLNDEYRVNDLIITLGEVQGIAEATG